MKSLSTLCLALALSACATLPSASVERALYRDLRKGIELSEDTGWTVDRLQLEANAEDALFSACQVPADRRDELDAWIGGQLALAGGEPEEIYARTGGDLDAAGGALTLSRTRALLRYASTRAGRDCPFWLEPDEEFIGVQGDADRIVFLLETRGFGGVFIEDGDADLAAGGAGRLLLGGGVGRDLTLAAGVELGGFGGLSESTEGARRIDATITGALPLLLRVTWFSRLLDVELAPVMHFEPNNRQGPPGVRLNVGGGFATMRGPAAFMPYAVLYAGYELHPAHDGRAQRHAIMLGTRVGVDFDP